MAISLPESARQVVGNGSIPGSWIHEVPLKSMRPCSWTDKPSNPRLLTSEKRQFHIFNLLSSLKILSQPQSFRIIATIGVLYAVYTCLQVSLSTLFVEIYHLNELQAGLVYLPFGVGAAITALLTGRQLDRDYRKTATKYNLSVEKQRKSTTAGFPIEEARLRNIWYPVLISIGGTAGYGWSLNRGVVSVPLSCCEEKKPTKYFSIWPFRWSCSAFLAARFRPALRYQSPATP